MPYPSSPYYSPEIDFDTPSSTFGSPLSQILESPPYSFQQTALPPVMLGTEGAYVIDQDSSVPLFYPTDGSSSPTGSDPEPRTPESSGDMDLEMGFAPDNGPVWEEDNPVYRE